MCRKSILPQPSFSSSRMPRNSKNKDLVNILEARGGACRVWIRADGNQSRSLNFLLIPRLNEPNYWRGFTMKERECYMS